MLRRRGTVALAIMAVALAWAAAFYSSPLWENDHYRYLWEGRMILEGHDPYRLAPAKALDLMHDRAAWSIYEKIGYPQVAAIYPPPVLGFFALASALFGGGIFSLKILAAGFLLAALLAAGPLLRRCGCPLWWLLLFAAHPLVLKEVLNSAHFEPLALLPVVLSFRATLEGRSRAAALYLGLAAAVRFYPLLFLPFYLGRWRGRDFLLCLAVCGAALSPLFLAGGGGWAAFAGHWLYHDGAFAMLRWGAATLGGSLGMAKALAVAIYLGIYGGIAWSLRRGHMTLAEAHLLTLLSLLLLSPVINPWYLLWLFPFALLAPLRPYWRGAALYWSVAVLFAYTYWVFGATPGWLRAIEQGPVWGFLALGIWRSRTTP